MATVPRFSLDDTKLQQLIAELIAAIAGHRSACSPISSQLDLFSCVTVVL